jgi:hypothetical protein
LEDTWWYQGEFVAFVTFSCFVANNRTALQHGWWRDDGPWKTELRAQNGCVPINPSLCVISWFTDPNVRLEVYFVGFNDTLESLAWVQRAQGWETGPIRSLQRDVDPTAGIHAMSRFPSAVDIFFVTKQGGIENRFWYDPAHVDEQEVVPVGRPNKGTSMIAMPRCDATKELKYGWDSE